MENYKVLAKSQSLDYDLVLDKSTGLYNILEDGTPQVEWGDETLVRKCLELGDFVAVNLESQSIELLSKGVKGVYRVDPKVTKDAPQADPKQKHLSNLGLDEIALVLDVPMKNPNPTSLIIKSDQEHYEDFLNIERQVLEELPELAKSRIFKAQSSHLPDKAERFSYTTGANYGIVHIPVNRLKQVYQTDDAINPAKVNSNAKRMKAGEPLEPVEIGYNYDVHDGHHRWEAAKKLGHTHVPCKVVGKDPNKVKEARQMYASVWKSEFLYLDLVKGGVLNKGKLIRRRIAYKGKNGQTFYREAWVKPDQMEHKEHRSTTDDKGKEHHSFQHDNKVVKEIEKRQSNRFPVVHMPVGEAKNSIHNYRKNDELYQRDKHKYQEGEGIEPARISPTGEILSGHHLFDLAKEVGATHVPSIIVGNSVQKKEMERKYAEKQQVLDEDSGKAVDASTLGISRDGTRRGQHLVNDVKEDRQGLVLKFKLSTCRQYPKDYLMQVARDHGIKFDETDKEGNALPPNIMWIKAHMAIVNFINDGGDFKVEKNLKEQRKRAKQSKYDAVHTSFLEFTATFNNDRDSIKEWCIKNGVEWKPNRDPSIDWKNCAMAIKKQLALGKMLNGVRTRQKDAKAEAELVITDEIRDHVSGLREQFGREAVVKRAEELGIEWKKTNKEGRIQDINDENDAKSIWMKAHMAIAKYMAQGNKFEMTSDDDNTEGRIQAERGDYGDAELNTELKSALDVAKNNSRKYEQKSRKWALKMFAVDYGMDEGQALEAYNTLVENARNSKLMYHFDPLEMLDNGAMMIEELMTDPELKNDYRLGKVPDKEYREAIEDEIFGDDVIGTCPDEQRPIYGVLDVFNEGINSADHGQIALVMKDELKKRSSTLATGSSDIPYGREGKLVHSSEDAHHTVIRQWADRWANPNKPDAKRKRAVDSILNGTPYHDDGYSESQMMGAIKLDEHVDHVLVPSDWLDDHMSDHLDMVKALAEHYNLSIKYGE